jgi:hypothetical protein
MNLLGEAAQSISGNVFVDWLAGIQAEGDLTFLFKGL